MEEDSREIVSPLLSLPETKKQFDYLQKTVDEAQKRIDYTNAHDEDILKAISVVERFLRKKERVCYGGQAINSLLPAKRRFYNPNYNVPDYDFFSPNVEGDVDELVDMLEKEGFEEVNKRVGMHEGTMKVYVNFVPVADCSLMNPKIFKIIQKRAVKVDGVLFCDPDFLRMMMYLELSRPRGEVSRWKKVYERLTLLNHAYPSGSCDEKIKNKHMDEEDRKNILEFCIHNKRSIVGPEVIYLMEKNKNTIGMESLVGIGGPVFLFSPQADTDANDIKDMLGDLRIERKDALTDQLFNCVLLTREKAPVAIIFQEEACLGYTLLHVKGKGDLRLGTPDTLLHLYYSLLIFGTKEKSYFKTEIECCIQKIHSILATIRTEPTKFLPAFSLRCSGHQKGMATLLKEKAERTKDEKKKLQTKKQSKTKKSQSHKIKK